jgi:predicted choloylglycine hydrolase
MNIKLKNKHKKIIEDYDNIKSNHLEKLGNKMLKNEEMFRKLKEKKLSTNFLKQF